MSGSRVVAVKQAVVAGLTALPALSAVTVEYAYKPAQTLRQRIWLGRAIATHEPAALRAGRNYRDERMTFDLVVLVEKVGGTAEEAETDALTIGTVVEEWVADNKTGAGVSGLSQLTITGAELISLFNDRGHLAELTYQISYVARLT